MATTAVADTTLLLKEVIANLYILVNNAHGYQDEQTKENIANEIKRLVSNLIDLCQTSQRLPTYIPLDIIEYVERSRNPDIYTREFVELIMRYNQELKGRTDAFASFRDVLGREMYSAIPEIQTEVRNIVEAAGGSLR
ncbi:hypothetical protein K470DRAFT_260356 [Piedraia hortae CBS 480.64]|uniref:Mediator of RNA polymerase II transcription subunit 10 n=1 Tax=Piedraia hortae CBS 480.64 TaxID=1314780 RepID=A0A6A7BT71_9PEZI|nr:hypothetical protein K470DRAFT_260356 [Piedraia hortae CBS 480.64]